MEHNVIVDSQRHELKHADAATANQVWKANGDGTSRTDFVVWSEITGKPTSKGYQQLIYGASVAANQSPSATNTPLQVEFGGAQTTADVSLSAAGVLTFNTSGYYYVSYTLQHGRATSTGSAIIFDRILYNGSQILSSYGCSLDANVQIIPYLVHLAIVANAGDNMLVQTVRDSAGANDGGLFRAVPTVSGWVACPSASILVSKLQGLG